MAHRTTSIEIPLLDMADTKLAFVQPYVYLALDSCPEIAALRWTRPDFANSDTPALTVAMAQDQDCISPIAMTDLPHETFMRTAPALYALSQTRNMTALRMPGGALHMHHNIYFLRDGILSIAHRALSLVPFDRDEDVRKKYIRGNKVAAALYRDCRKSNHALRRFSKDIDRLLPGIYATNVEAARKIEKTGCYRRLSHIDLTRIYSPAV